MTYPDQQLPWGGRYFVVFLIVDAVGCTTGQFSIDFLHRIPERFSAADFAVINPRKYNQNEATFSQPHFTQRSIKPSLAVAWHSQVKVGMASMTPYLFSTMTHLRLQKIPSQSGSNEKLSYPYCVESRTLQQDCQGRQSAFRTTLRLYTVSSDKEAHSELHMAYQRFLLGVGGSRNRNYTAHLKSQPTAAVSCVVGGYHKASVVRFPDRIRFEHDYTRPYDSVKVYLLLFWR